MHHVPIRPLGPSLGILRRCRPAWRCLSSAARSYTDAIDALNSLQTPHALLEARKKAGIRPDASFVREMKAYLQRIGYKLSDLNRLNVIHVSGTKGKGSTCAFVDSILSQYQCTRGVPSRTGMFISPHLIAVRERIRINSKPISEDLFTKYFFEVWDLLGASGIAAADAQPGSRPVYARFLTLMSWHVFLQEQVDMAVYETGIGGEFDATNLVERPVATGITTLGIDHVFALGDTLAKIAWHKAGIMKTGSPAFTVEQLPEASKVLRERAAERAVDLKFLKTDPRLETVAIRPNADFQKKNASLAVSLAETALAKIGTPEPSTGVLPKEFVDGLEKVIFRGRCEIKQVGNATWYIDGAHEAISLKASATWFAEECAGRSGQRVMIFNQQGRSEAVNFFESIYAAVKRAGKPAFDHVIFCTNMTFAKSGFKREFVNHQFDVGEITSMTVQKRFAEKWSSVDPLAKVSLIPTIEQAIDFTKKLQVDDEQQVHVFVTGSLHLVGGVLGILEQTDAL